MNAHFIRPVTGRDGINTELRGHHLCDLAGIDDADGDIIEKDWDQPKGLSIPYISSQREIYEQELPHIQFRSWCKHCVKARGCEAGHLRAKNDERSNCDPTAKSSHG